MTRGELGGSGGAKGTTPMVNDSELSCAIWGVLNVTPDSFSDGGLYSDLDHALRRARHMVEEGATVIDVGGESTRPAGDAYGEGYRAVSAAEELERVLPVLRALAASNEVTLSVDTVKAEVAEAALDAGAHIVNDVSTGRSSTLLEVVASRGAELVLMHNRGHGEVKRPHIDYDDVVEDVRRELLDAAARAERHGVDPAKIWLDPGVGFAKTADQSLRLIARIDRLLETGHRVLVGASRKSFIAKAAPLPLGDEPPSDARLGGTAAVSALLSRAGVHALRVHDVAEMRQAAMVGAAIARQEAPS